MQAIPAAFLLGFLLCPVVVTHAQAREIALVNSEDLRCYGVERASRWGAESLTGLAFTLDSGKTVYRGKPSFAPLPDFSPDEQAIVDAVASDFRVGALAYYREWMTPIAQSRPLPETLSPEAARFIEAFIGCLDRKVGI
ncbi:hypothetical protein [Thioclava sp. F36-6]|uniref:hypothetical protein n=1 Tax=Thioclava sp. F36-6 TaxID=1915316 RepID=UPI0011BA4893|nr:hypothetical protein [Thioclava sp. F36-6]